VAASGRYRSRFRIVGRQVITWNRGRSPAMSAKREQLLDTTELEHADTSFIEFSDGQRSAT